MSNMFPELADEILSRGDDRACVSYLPSGDVILLKDMSASLTADEYGALRKYGTSIYYDTVATGDGYRIIAKKGLVYDLASIPWLGRLLMMRDRIPEASTVHDALYAHTRRLPKELRGEYRLIADRLFKRHLRTQEPALNAISRAIIYYSVRIFGKGAVNG